MKDNRVSDKLVSLIMPTYNRAWCIERAIKSVFEQTYKNWELIIIDGGSTDNTEEVIKKYLNDKRIRYIKFSKNKGVNFARNKGIDNTKGEYITFLDSDDELKSDALETINYEFDRTDDKIGVLVFNAEDINGNIYGTFPKTKKLVTFKDLIKEDVFSGEKFGAIKANIFRNGSYRFPEVLRGGGGGLEGILWNSIAKEYNFLFISKSLRIYYTEHADRLTGGGQIVRRSKTMPKLYTIFLKKFKRDYLKYNPKGLGYIYLEKGLFEIIANKKKIGRESIKNAVKYNKKKLIIASLIYIFSFLPNNIFIKLTKFGHSFKKVLK